MVGRKLISHLGLVAGLALLPLSGFADPALDWLSKIQMSTAKTSYQGTFVYRQGDQLEVMRIAHRVDNGRIRERLYSLNGWAREIIRNNDEVICYLPDKKAAMAGHRLPTPAEAKFPDVLPDEINQLTRSYRIQVRKAERIAGHRSMLVSITPLDQFRYGYRLWADRNTGLLLKSDLVDEQGRIVEQFMFTNVDIGSDIQEKDLQPVFRDKSMVWHRAGANAKSGTTETGWRVTDMPDGYRVTGNMVRNVPGKSKPVTHLVVSDGLAAVSVFIESSSESVKKEQMVTGMGAAHAYRASIGNHQLTAVGEVPAIAVERIGRSVQMVR
jgi:sigma-E factor negative regulatory protein RseB